MSFRKGQSGNPGGRSKDRAWRDALRLAVNRLTEDGEQKLLNVIAEKLVALALEGNLAAIREIADRLDGKPIQAVSLDADIEVGNLESLSEDELNRRIAERLADPRIQTALLGIMDPENPLAARWAK